MLNSQIAGFVCGNGKEIRLKVNMIKPMSAFSSISQTNYPSLTITNLIPYDVKPPNNTAVLLRANGQNGSFWNSVFKLNADLCTDLSYQFISSALCVITDTDSL